MKLANTFTRTHNLIESFYKSDHLQLGTFKPRPPVFSISTLKDWNWLKTEIGKYLKPEIENWRLEIFKIENIKNWKIGNWKLETLKPNTEIWNLKVFKNGNWTLKIANWKLEIEDWKQEIGNWSLKIHWPEPKLFCI